jgi:sterol desaturase/sphingolipid hydroxylase (fatty acid hydroxylase superfamily)
MFKGPGHSALRSPTVSETFLSLVGGFAQTYLGQLLGYFAVVGVVFVVTRRWAASRLARRRIHTRGRRCDRAQLGHEVRHSLVVLAIGTLQLVVLLELQRRGLVELREGLGPWGVPGLVAGLVGLILFNDLWFYAVHRLLHTRWLYKRVHAVHHRSVDVNPFSSYSFHGVEALLLTGWLVPVALLIPIPLPVLMAAQVIGLINNLMAHLGYELLPTWWTRTPVLRWSNSATFHALHHERFQGNYGLFTRVWDRVFRTELDGYERAFAAAHAAADPVAAEMPPTQPERERFASVDAHDHFG